MERDRYFIGYELPEKQKKEAEKIAGALVQEYGIPNVFKRGTPHITFKAPFEQSIHELQYHVKPFLEKFVKARTPIDFTLEGFGHFCVCVIYWDVLPGNTHLTDMQKDLCEGLESFKAMTFERNEPNGIPHVTVAKNGITGRFRPMYNFLKEKFIGYELCTLDRLHLFHREGHKWKVMEEFMFTS